MSSRSGNGRPQAEDVPHSLPPSRPALEIPPPPDPWLELQQQLELWRNLPQQQQDQQLGDLVSRLQQRDDSVQCPRAPRLDRSIPICSCQDING
mmetsp:Transcript_10019/g.22434  ORF Transcript_10019/g.22434 Transcript_10019/m.22434 type:complete len:94 (+) Transcript_10019:441-722(+)